MSEPQKIDVLLLVGVRAVQRDVEVAKLAHDRYMAELFKRYGLDTSKLYHFGDDGTVTEADNTGPSHILGAAAGNGR